MAENLTSKISQLVRVLFANTSRNTSMLVGNDDTGTTRRWSPGDITDAAGDIKIRGDVVGVDAKLNSNVVTTIQPGVVTLAKQANMNTNRLIGRSTAGSGSPEEIAIGSGLTLVGGQLAATAVQTAQPTLGLLVYQRVGKF